MSKFKLNDLVLENFDCNNKDHLLYLKELMRDNEVKSRFNGLELRVHSLGENFTFGKGYFVSFDSSIIGYLHMGKKNENDDVYLRYTIRENVRKLGYGTKLLDEVTNYLCLNYRDINNIFLKIDRDNIGSLKVAKNAGYTWSESEYYNRRNKNYMEGGINK